MITYTHGCKAPGNGMTIGPIAVSDQVVWCFIPRIRWAIHSAVGLLVTVSDISRRRWCLRMTKTKSNLKPIVGTIRKSMAAMLAAWLRRKVFQVCDRPRPLRAIYLATVD